MLSEKKDFERRQVAFIFHAPYRLRRAQLMHAFEVDVAQGLRGTVDWEID